MNKKLTSIAISLFLSAAYSGNVFSDSVSKPTQKPVLVPASKTAVKVSTNECVVLQTSKGDILLNLDKQKAPVSVSNFLGYTNAKFYNGTLFHRVIPGFMIQGGGFTDSFQEKSTNAPIVNEADNGLLNTRGTIAMARTFMPQSATAQFFINTVDNDFLNFKNKSASGWGYAVFGKVVKGMEVVDSISKTPTGGKGPFPTDVPLETIVIKEAKVAACQ